MPTPISLTDALAGVDAHWSPRVVGRVNDQYIKVAKVKGQLVWHAHPDEDEMFLVLYGKLVIEMEDGNITLGPGECFVVLKGTRHNPVAEEECGIVLIETVSTLHTGDANDARAVSLDEQLSRFTPAT
jgi:mannose-6-phosphate isomerase-like protein (cupin superfamily)